jgi:hypothetical protein
MRDVQFVTQPPGARVVVDKTGPSCSTPCIITLDPARHTLLATLDGYRDVNKIFNVTGNTDVSWTMEQKKGTLNVVSIPPGATILINGKAREERTPARFVLPEGKYTLAIAKGDARVQQDVVIQDETVRTYTANLGIK